MKTNAKISVIVPCFNVTKYLENCIESLRNQTLDNKFYEIVLIDDCSTDKATTKIIEKYQGIDNIRCIFNQVNQGLGLTRNVGVDSLSDEITHITFVDSDDMLELDALEQMLDKALEGNYDMVKSFEKTIVEKKDGTIVKGSERTKAEYKIDLDDFDPVMTRRFGTYAWGILFSRTFYEKVNFKFSKGAFEDIPILIFYFSNPKIYFLEKAKYIYLLRKTGISGTLTKPKMYDFFKMLDEVAQFNKAHNISVLKDGYRVEEIYDHRILASFLSDILNYSFDGTFNWEQTQEYIKILEDHLYCDVQTNKILTWKLKFAFNAAHSKKWVTLGKYLVRKV